MQVNYVCPLCKEVETINSFWKWLSTPHYGARKYLFCKNCKKKRYMHRKDGGKWLDWPGERKEK